MLDNKFPKTKSFLYKFTQMTTFLPAPEFKAKSSKNEKLLPYKVKEYVHFYWESF